MHHLSLALVLLLAACGAKAEETLVAGLESGMNEEDVIAVLGEPKLRLNEQALIRNYGFKDAHLVLSFLIDNPKKTDSSDSHLMVICAFDHRGLRVAKAAPANVLGKVKKGG